MIARCQVNKLEDLENPLIRSHIEESVHLEETGLELGKDYRIEGIMFRDGLPWFYICEEADSEYPVPHCSIFFDLIDSEVPQGWKLVLEPQLELLPAKWADFPHFYELLVDDDPEAIALFGLIRRTGH